MRQDPNNYHRGERPNPQAPRPRWQNGGYFPYNNQQTHRPAVNPVEVRTPPGLTRPPQQVAPPPRVHEPVPYRPVPQPAPVHAAPPVQHPQHRTEYYGDPRQGQYAPMHAAPQMAPPQQQQQLATLAPPPQAGYYEEPYQEPYAPMHESYAPVLRERAAPTREPISSAPPRRRGNVVRVILLVLLCAVIAGGTGAFVAQMVLRDWESLLPNGEAPGIYSPIETPTPTPESTPLPEGILSATEISELGRQQVVSIRAEVSDVDAAGNPVSRVASGTGFIISNDGYILTNYHVIAGATRITVSMDNGSSFEAMLLGGEFVTSDLAVLKIEAMGLSPAQIGRSAELQVGTPIYVVGNPLDLSHSLTSGLVSALDRDVSIDHGQVISMFQIDASVNPGNSGGPVYNQFGEIVGIVTAKSSMDGVEGIGFALPIDDAMRYAQQIIARGPAPTPTPPPAQPQGDQPWLGISPITISPEDAEEFDIVPGVFVQGMYPDTAAARGGMQEGDIIVSLGGIPTFSVEALRDAMAGFAIGDTIEVTVWRDGEMLSLTLTLTARPAD